jgi:murein DD-endopeptidase MepM/ murein hydrolase activator NlpD
VDIVRDLRYVEPWQESLERSRARRGKPMPSPNELNRRRLERDIDRDEQWGRAFASRGRWLGSAIAKRPMLLLASPTGILAIALLAGVLPAASDGFGPQASARAAKGSRAAAVSSPAASGPAASGSQAAGLGAPPHCELLGLVDRPTGYVNPLAGAALTPKRIDQGVDYTAGSGTLTAIGAARVTVVATSDTGWPGAYIEYQLADGPAAGCYVFYAEGVSPATDLQVGEPVRAGQPIATIIPGYSSGIEIGWGAGIGTETYAAEMGEWSATADDDSIPTAAGESFSSLITSLGGPPGKIEG